MQNIRKRQGTSCLVALSLGRRQDGKGSSTINTNQQTITEINQQCDKTHSRTFSVGTLALDDRRTPRHAASAASWAFFAVAVSRCSFVQIFFEGLVEGLERLRVGSAELPFAFFSGEDGDAGERRLRGGDALSFLEVAGFFLSAGYSRGGCLPRQTLASSMSNTNFLTAYEFLNFLRILPSSTFSSLSFVQS